MAVKRIDSIFNIDSLQEEFDVVATGLEKSQQGIERLFASLQKNKSANLGTLAASTEEAEQAMVDAEAATEGAKKANDEFAKSAATVIKSTKEMSTTYAGISSSLEDNIKTQLRNKASMKDAQDELKKLQKEYGNTTATAAELETKEKELQDAINTFKSASPSIQKKNAGALDELNKQMDDLQKLKQANAEAAASNDPLIQKQVELAKTIETLKQANTELQRAIRLQVKENNSASDSIDQLKAQYDRLYQVFRGLSDVERGADIGTELSNDLQMLSSRINELQKGAGNFTGNVGRYAESLQKPFDMLADKLQELRSDLSKGIGIGGSTDPAAIAAAEKAVEGISNALTKASKDGASTTTQINALNDAFAVTVSTFAKGDSTNTFVADLGQQIGLAKQELTDFQAKTDNLTKVVTQYSGQFSNAFDVLVNSLAEVRQKMQGMDKDTAGFKKLEQEEKLLTQLTMNLGKAFKNPTQELRAFQNTAKALGQQFGITSDQFNAFAREVGDKKDEIQDLQASINFNASDTKYLDGIVSAVNGVAGAYGVAESAQTLFGDGSEETQKQMVKLQAILTLVTSLQAVLNALQTESGAVQVALAAKTGLLNAAKTVQAFLSGAVAAAAQAEAIANTEVAASTGAATVGLTTEAAAAEAATIALGTEAVAAEGAAAANVGVAGTADAAAVGLAGEAAAAGAAEVATTGFATAFVATGIGALIIALAAGVVYLVSKLGDWNKSNFDVGESNKALADTLKDLNAAQVEYNNSMRETSNRQIDLAEKAAAKQKEAGVNAIQSLAIDKEVAKTKLDNVKQEVLLNDVSLDSVKKLQTEYEVAALGVRAAEEIKQQALQNAAKDQKKLSKDQVELLDQNIESFRSEYNAAKSSYDLKAGILKRTNDAEQESALVGIKEAKLSADERRKLLLESAKLEADIISNKNQHILADEQSNQEQRLEAIKSNATQQRKVIAAELAAVQSDPTKKGTADETIAIQNASNARIKVNRDEKDQLFAIDEQYRKRQLAAELEISKIRLGLDKQVQEELISDQNLSLDERYQALQKYSADGQQLLLEDFQHTQATTIMTQEEQLKLQADYHAKQVALAKDVQDKAFQILKDQFTQENDLRQDHLKDFQMYIDKLELLSMNQYNSDVQELNDQLQQNKISYAKYLEERERLDKNYATNSLRVQLDSLKTQLSAIQDHEKDLKDVTDEITNLKYQAAVADDDVDKQAFLAKIKRLELLQDQYKKDAAERLKLEKQIAEVTGALQKKTTDDDEDENKKRQQHLESLLDGIAQSISNITQAINAIYDARAAEVNQTEDDQQRAYEREKDRITKSVQNEEDRNDQLMRLESIRQDQKVQNENKLREIEIQRAKFEKAANVANIIATTALAVVKALASGGPFAIPLAITIGALGAVQLGIALATPIPKFRGGKKVSDNYSGPGIVGDVLPGNGPEYIGKADGRILETPTVDTLVKIEKTDRIWPNKKAMLREMGAYSQKPTLRVIPIVHQGVSKRDMEKFSNNIVDAVGNIKIRETILTHRGWREQNRRIEQTNAWIKKQGE